MDPTIAGDAGGALGAALAVWHLHHKQKRNVSSNSDSMKGSYLGPKFSDKEIYSELKNVVQILKIDRS